MDLSCYGETRLRISVIVAEQGELWLAALRTGVRRSAPLRAVPEWVHVRSREEIAPTISRDGGPLVVLQVTPSSAAKDVLHVEAWRKAFPAACFVAAIDRSPGLVRICELEWALREAGAVHVLTSPRRTTEVLPILERHGTRLKIASSSDGAWGPPWTIASDLPPCWSDGSGS